MKILTKLLCCFALFSCSTQDHELTKSAKSRSSHERLKASQDAASSITKDLDSND